MVVTVTSKLCKDFSTKETIDKSENGEWSQDLWAKLAEIELFSIGVSEELGGFGGDYKDACSVIYLAGKYAVPLPLSETIIGKWVLSELGQTTKDEPLTFSFEEGNEVQITKSNNSVVVTGTLSEVPWGRHAKSIVTLGTMNGKSYVVQLPVDKAVVHKINNIAGEPRDTVEFEAVVLEGLSLYTVDRDAFKEKMMNLATLSRIVMMAGAMERILELSVRYSSEREQFGRPLHRFQAIQHHLSELAGETVIAISSMNNAIEAYEEGQFSQELAHARIRINEAAGKVATSAHQLHGAIGVTYEHSLHQYTRRLWAWREEYGNEAVWVDKLVAQLMENADESLWEIVTSY